MIRVTLPDRILGLSFSHPTVHVDIEELMIRHGKNKDYMKKLTELVTVGADTIPLRVTRCDIFEIDEDKKTIEHVAEGVAKCSILDNFCKWEGRKIALSKALTALFPTPHDKLYREEVWMAYHDRDTDSLVIQLEKQMRATEYTRNEAE